MTKFCVQRPIATSMIYGALLLLSAISFSKLEVSLFPELNVPKVTIATPFPNVGALEVEQLITKPIEDSISSVSGVKKIRSRSQEGLSIIDIDLDWDTSIDVAIINLRQKVDQVRTTLPQDSEKSMLIRFDSGAEPVVVLVAKSIGMEPKKARDFIENQARPLFERIEGVAGVSIIGGYRREIQVHLDNQKIHAHQLSLQSILRAISGANYSYPVGSVKEGDKELSVIVEGEFQTVDEIAQTPIGLNENGVPILLSQVAEIKDDYKIRKGAAFYNGEESILVALKGEPTRNILLVAKNIRDDLEIINSKYSRSLHFSVIQDRSIYVSSAISDVRDAAILGGIIAVIVLYLFLKDIIPAIIISLSIPVSILLTFLLFYLKGISLNVMSLGGLALGVGMLLDSGIVVIESIEAEKRLHPKRAKSDSIIIGTKNVSGSVISAALTTIIVFVPIIFVSGLAGAVFTDFAYSISFSLISSLVCSLTLIPMLASLEDLHLFLNKLNKFLNPKLARAFRLADSFVSLSSHVYSHAIDYSLKRPLSILCWSLGLALLGGVLFLFVPKSLFPAVDQGVVTAHIDLPGGSDIVENAQLQVRLHNYLIKNGLVKHVVTIAGYDEDDFLSRINGIKQPGSSESTFIVNQENLSSSEFIQLLKKTINDSSNSRLGIKMKGDSLEEVLGEEGNQWVVDVEGEDRNEGREIAEKLKQELQKHASLYLESTSDASQPEIEVTADRVRLTSFGITPEYLAQNMRTSIGGSVASRFRESDKQVDIRVHLRSEDRMTSGQLDSMFIQTPEDQSVSLAGSIELKPSMGYPVLFRENQKSIERLKVSFDSDSDMDVSHTYINSAVVPLQSEYPHSSIGIHKDNQETMDSLTDLLFSFVLSAILIYQLLAGQFESLFHPFSLAMMIPMMLIGVSISLLVTGNTLNISSAIGIVLLAGIVVDSATVLFEHIEQSIGENRIQLIQRLPEILKHSGETRIRAILLTTLTNLLGSLPAALSSGNLQAPMAITVIGGLSVSLVLTLVVFPTMYLLIERLKISRGLR